MGARALPSLVTSAARRGEYHEDHRQRSGAPRGLSTDIRPNAAMPASPAGQQVPTALRSLASPAAVLTREKVGAQAEDDGKPDEQEATPPVAPAASTERSETGVRASRPGRELAASSLAAMRASRIEASLLPR